jgi:hypothetical protein
MKSLVLVIGILFISANGYSQEFSCATEISKEYAEKMKQSMPAFEAFKQSFHQNVSSSSRISSTLKKNSIPVKIHIVRQNNGSTDLDTAYMRKGLDFMNRTFENSGLEFYVCGNYNYINNTTYYTIDNTEYETLNNTYGTANVINIYFVNGISFYGSSATGVAPTPGGSHWVILRNNADTTVYPHEMGHFFGLLHTHGYSNTVKTDEFVDGSNCHEAGDYFCDTPADPRLSPAIVNAPNVNAQCVYFGNQKDGHNQVYVPDATNIMSYAPSKCLSHFSPDQLAYMHWVYINRRSNLTCSSVNVNFNTSNSIACDSPYVFQFQKQTTGVSNLQWDVNDDGITDYTSNNPSHSFGSPGIKWVSLSGTAGGKTYMRYKPVEISTPYKVPKLIDFNNSSLLPTGWKLYNPDVARGWEITAVKGIDGQNSNAYRFRNYNYIGYEEEDAIITNAYDLKNYKNARLTFDIAYAPHTVSDTFLVYLSTDCGNTYPYQILKLAGSSLQTHAKQFQEFIPGEADWKNVIVSLNTYVNNYVSFKIVNYNMGGNNLYIDNIRVEGGDSTLSEIGFARTLINTAENSSSGQMGCRGYRILSVPVFVSSAPASSITVNVSSSGTATNNYDFELLNNQIVFPAGQIGHQVIQVKIFDDAASETIESIILSLTIQGSTTYRTTNKNRTTTINIYDNDPINPAQKVLGVVLMDEKFENVNDTTFLPSGWIGTGNFFGTSPLFAIGNWFYDPELFTRSNSLDSTHYVMFWGNVGSIHPPSNEYMETNTINLSDFDSIIIEMDHWLKAYLPYTGDVVLEAWNGTTWSTVYFHAGLQGNLGANFKPEHLNISLTGFTNVDFKLRIGLKNEKSSYWYVVDNLKITGFKTKAKVAANLNAATTAYLGPNELVHFYDTATGNIIASVQNQSNWNYGCTTVNIDRAGNGAIPYMDANPTYHATQKTLLITPEFNNPNGNYDISLYYNNAEINGWLIATSNTLLEAGLVKSGGAIANISPANQHANGATNFSATNVANQSYLINDTKITGRFSNGFSGFAVVNTGNTSLLPIVLLNAIQVVYKNELGNEISWTTAQEFNCDYFEIQRSADATQFSTIATLDGHGNSLVPNSYMLIDNNFNNGKNYYRFKQVDFNGRFTYSNVVMVDNTKELQYSFELFPNPVKDMLTISINNKNKQPIVRIVNAFGQEMKVLSIENNQQNRIDISSFSNGVYFVTIMTDDKVETKTFVKQ